MAKGRSGSAPTARGPGLAALKLLDALEEQHRGWNECVASVGQLVHSRGWPTYVRRPLLFTAGLRDVDRADFMCHESMGGHNKGCIVKKAGVWRLRSRIASTS